MRRRAGVQLFASSPSDLRSRRPIDRLRVVSCLLLLLLTALLSEIASNVDRDFSAFLATLPDSLQVLWRVGFWAAIVWAIALLVITATRHRVRPALEGVTAAGLALVITVLAAAIVTGKAGDVVSHIADADGPPVFPPGVLAVTSAVLASMAPHLTQPFRRFGRFPIGLQLASALFLGASQLFGGAAALAIGLVAGATIHLVLGSPGGLPTVTRVRAALLDLGVPVEGLAPIAIGRHGVAQLTGSDADGPLEIKVYGRDAWEGELMASTWRLVWYRGSHRTARLSRGEYVEHEGFMTFLAARAGVRVPEVVTAGLADNGRRPDGTPLTDATRALTDEHVQTLWADLARLHVGGLAHRRLDLDRVVVREDARRGSATSRQRP